MLKFAIKLLINKFQINRYISWVQITFEITFSNITPFNIYIYIYIYFECIIELHFFVYTSCFQSFKMTRDQYIPL